MIICDTREKKWDHVKNYFERSGIPYTVRKVDAGDYMLEGDGTLAIDRKRSMTEVEGNIVHDHDRFRREALRALESGTHLCVLVENGRLKDLEDVRRWVNPRREKWIRINEAHRRGELPGIKIPQMPPVTGGQLYRIMEVMAERYGIEWRFCRHQDAGKVIYAMLTGRAL